MVQLQYHKIGQRSVDLELRGNKSITWHMPRLFNFVTEVLHSLMKQDKKIKCVNIENDGAKFCLLIIDLFPEISTKKKTYLTNK